MTSISSESSHMRALVPLGGNGADRIAIQMACDLVRKNKGQVYVLHVIEVERALPLDVELPDAVARGEEILQTAEETANKFDYHVEGELLQAREVGPAVVDEATQRTVDVIVIGLPYKSRFGEFSLGETVPYVLRHAPCRVWVCRETQVDGQ
jgi:nucleotide-binding universal stress UspA family protein